MLHIVITDTETGKVIHEADTKAIIGGYKTEAGTSSMCVANCGDFDLSMTILAAEEAIRSVKKQKGAAFAITTEMLPRFIKEAREELEKEEPEEKPEEEVNE